MTGDVTTGVSVEGKAHAHDPQRDPLLVQPAPPP